MHGATVVAVRGNFDELCASCARLRERSNIQIVNSINPDRIEGQKTAAFEICDALGRAPDFHLLPVGNAGNITAYWKGYREYRDRTITTPTPRMVGFQAAGAAPIVRGDPVAKPETIATAIRIGNPASWKPAEAARDESGGLIDMVTDAEIIDAYKLLAARRRRIRRARLGSRHCRAPPMPGEEIFPAAASTYRGKVDRAWVEATPTLRWRTAGPRPSVASARTPMKLLESNWDSQVGRISCH